jgi:heme exporter protein A
VRWRGKPIAKLRGEFLAEVAYIGHQHGVKGDLTARENLCLACSLGKSSMQASLDDVLQRVGLKDFSDVPTRTLSQGQKKRVALARLLVTSAQLWLLDEPLAALDIQGMELVEAMVSEHLGRGGMAVVSTHQPLALSQGQITQLDLG